MLRQTAQTQIWDMKQYIIIGFAALTIMSCGHEKELLLNEKVELTAKVDSLMVELETSQKASATLVQAMSLMDSIDMGRKMIRVALEETDSQEEFIDQMRELKSFVAQTNDKIAALEKTLKESKTAQGIYAKNLKNLKEQLEQQKSDIQLLEAKLQDEKSNNQKLLALNSLQSEAILDQEEKIAAKTLELELLEQQIVEMRKAFKISEADAYFTQGDAYALAAQRTKLAPGKKKNTYKQAIESYQKALQLGREDAKVKIETIEKKLH